jgi:hypothetical protein
MATTSPDNISYPVNTDSWATQSDLANEATSVQNAFNKRQRYQYVWANATARGAQTGMVEGSLGYQVDTQTDYIYSNTAWRNRLSYAEFNAAGVTVSSTAFTNFNTINITPGTSTDTTNFTTSANTIQVAFGGIYAISMYLTCNGSVTVNAYGLIGIASDYTTNLNSQIARAQFNPDAVAQTTIFYNAPSNQTFYFAWKQTDATSRFYSTPNIRVARLG